MSDLHFIHSWENIVQYEQQDRNTMDEEQHEYEGNINIMSNKEWNGE